MPRIPIAALDDGRLDVYRNLKSTNMTRHSGLLIAEGKRVVQRLISSGFILESVLASEHRVEQMAPFVGDDIPLYVLPRAMARELLGYNFHNGVLACARRKPAPDWKALVAPLESRRTLIVCPEINDPSNLGSIIRISAAFGADALLLGPGSADPLSRRVSRLSMGSCFRLPSIQCDDLKMDVERLKRDWGFELAGAVLDQRAEPLQSARRTGRLAILFGNEAQGLEPCWAALCDRLVTIPMPAGTDSLNVAVAAGIFLYHFTRLAGIESV